jgi:hypothetical protein
MSVQSPTYKVEFWNGANFRHGFGYGYDAHIVSLRVKPGLTSAIGSFEISIPDTGSSGNAFNNIGVYEDVYIGLGYTTDPGNTFFRGKIDTVKMEFSANQGWLRIFSGRDYGEALLRYLERQAFTGSASGSTIILKDDSGLNSDNQYIVNETALYALVMDNTKVFDGMNEISDFINKDFNVDTNSKLHWFERQSTVGSNTFVVGTNIISYRFFDDITDSFNQYYVFGLADSSVTSGSYWPINRDSYTENETGSWRGYANSGSDTEVTIFVDAVNYKTGSYSLYGQYNLQGGVPAWIKLIYTLTGSLMLNSNDFVDFWRCGYITSGPGSNHYYASKVKLKTDDDNYFECNLEEINANNPTRLWVNYHIPVGPEVEGGSLTGSIDQNTGSYKWSRVGRPDWYNINKFELDAYGSAEFLNLYNKLWIDGLYFGTRFQFQSGSTGSQTRYGFRPKVIIDDRYNSTEYCKNVATILLEMNSGSTRQIEIITTGSPNLSMGYRYAITIPSEGISAQYYELIDLEHRIDAGEGFTSKCLLTDKKQLRVPIPLINYAIQAAISKQVTMRDIERRLGARIPSWWP